MEDLPATANARRSSISGRFAQQASVTDAHHERGVSLLRRLSLGGAVHRVCLSLPNYPPVTEQRPSLCQTIVAPVPPTLHHPPILPLLLLSSPLHPRWGESPSGQQPLLRVGDPVAHLPPWARGSSKGILTAFRTLAFSRLGLPIHPQWPSLTHLSRTSNVTTFHR